MASSCLEDEPQDRVFSHTSADCVLSDILILSDRHATSSQDKSRIGTRVADIASSPHTLV